MLSNTVSIRDTNYVACYLPFGCCRYDLFGSFTSLTEALEQGQFRDLKERREILYIDCNDSDDGR